MKKYKTVFYKDSLGLRMVKWYKSVAFTYEILTINKNIQVLSVAPKITDGERMNKVKQNHLQCYNHKQN